jgi:UDP-2,3-diacylglucosamine pyrophosphatase LpxH
MAIPAFIARHLGEEAYRTRIGRGLTEAHGRAGRRDIELTDLRAVVFSDHHRGVGDGADDFRRCEPAYCAALGWYLEQGYELWLLGDVEELWENSSRKVMKHYENVLALEAQFGDRLRRFYGNHDMEWRSSRYVEKFLARHVPGTAVEEAVRIVITRSGEPLGTLFLVHGHQGTTDSGNLLVVPFSRMIVRFVWGTLQRRMSFASTSPASDDLLRGQHDRAMAAWADAHPERLVMVAGHTHRPVFADSRPADLAADAREREAAYQQAKASGSDIATARAAREMALARELRDDHYEPVALERPSYFNTGCCSFGDGDVTALEFSGEQVRLVRWLDAGGGVAPHPLEPARDLTEIFGRVTGQAPDRAGH